MTPTERADRAKEMLESAIFRACFDDLRAVIVSKLEAAPFTDAALHHEITLALQALNSVKVQFNRYVDEGTLSRHKASQDEYVARMKQSVRA
jgi:hypothetical protein